MTGLPNEPGAKKLGLVIDLDICVGCHACAVSCKEWNTGGYSAPLSDLNPYADKAEGAWLNVKINLGGLDDAKRAAGLREEGRRLLEQARAQRDRILAVVDEKIGD